MLQPTFPLVTNSSLAEVLYAIRVESDALPHEEEDVLATAVRAAAYLAGQGRPEEGHACLQACARRSELARSLGETWAEALAARYRDVMEIFAIRHGLTRC